MYETNKLRASNNINSMKFCSIYVPMYDYIDIPISLINKTRVKMAKKQYYYIYNTVVLLCNGPLVLYTYTNTYGGICIIYC